MDKKKFKIKFDSWDAVVEIEQSESTLSAMKEQLLFWTSGQSKISAANGDIQLAFLTALGAELCECSMHWNIEFIKSTFDDREGWADLRGSYGVELISTEHWFFDEDQFCFEEV